MLALEYFGHTNTQLKKTQRVSRFHKFENTLSFLGIDFPVKLNQIPKFEKLNNLKVKCIRL